LKWADSNNTSKKDLLCTCNLAKDLLNQKDIKPVDTHKKNIKTKSILKGSTNSTTIVNPPNQTNISKIISNSSTTLAEVKRPLTTSRLNVNESPEIIPSKPSNFYVISDKANLNSNNQFNNRPVSVDAKEREKPENNSSKNTYTVNSTNNIISSFLKNNNNNKNYNLNDNNISNNNINPNLNDTGTKILNFQNIINNNINNFYIQPPNSNIPSNINESYKKENSNSTKS